MACAIDRTIPPSTRKAAPLIADATGLATNATSAATSEVSAKPWIGDEGRVFSKNSFSTSYEYRLVFDFISESQVLLIDIGTHDEVY